MTLCRIRNAYYGLPAIAWGRSSLIKDYIASFNTRHAVFGTGFFSIFSKDRIVRHFFEFLKVTGFLIELILINFYNFPNNSEILAWLIAIAGKDFYLLKIML